MSATIYDVAEKAGVSFQLASAVLGRKKYAHASAATRKRIFDAALQLNYRSNTAAVVLAGGSSKILGVIIDSRAPESVFRILAEIEGAADKLGYRILTAQAHDNPGKLLDSYHALRQNGVDGIISFAHDYSPLNCHLDDVLKDDPRIVYVLEAPEYPCSSVDVDIAAAMQDSVDHLREQGCRKIALLLNRRNESTPLSFTCVKRAEGFRKACPEGTILHTFARQESIPDIKSVCGKLLRDVLIPQHFDAVIAQNDFFAASLMNRMLAQGIRIPQDFSIVGWNDNPYNELLPISMTSVAFDAEAIAASTLKILLDKIDGNADPVQIKHPLKLVIRESSRKNRMRQKFFCRPYNKQAQA